MDGSPPPQNPPPSTLTPSTLTPSALAPSALAPSALAPSALAPSDLAPSDLAPSDPRAPPGQPPLLLPPGPPRLREGAEFCQDLARGVVGSSPSEGRAPDSGRAGNSPPEGGRVGTEAGPHAPPSPSRPGPASIPPPAFPSNPPPSSASDPPSAFPSNPPPSSASDPPSAFPSDPPSAFPSNPPSAFPSNPPSAFPSNPASPSTSDPPSPSDSDPPSLSISIPSSPSSSKSSSPSSNCSSPSPSNPPSPSPSNPPSPSPSNPPSPSPSNPPSPSPSNPPSPSPSNPPSPSPSNPPSPSASNPLSPSPSNPPSPTASNPPSPSASNPLSPCASNPPSPSASNRPSPTASNPPSPSASNRPSPTASNPPSSCASNPPSPSASNRPSPTASNPLSPSPSNPPSPTASNPPSSCASNPLSPSPSNPPSPCASNPPSPCASNPPSPCASNPLSPSPSNPPSPSASNPPSPSTSNPPSPSASNPPSPSTSNPPSPSTSNPPSPSASNPPSPSASSPPSPFPSHCPSPSPTNPRPPSPSKTPSLSPSPSSAPPPSDADLQPPTSSDPGPPGDPSAPGTEGEDSSLGGDRGRAHVYFLLGVVPPEDAQGTAAAPEAAGEEEEEEGTEGSRSPRNESFRKRAQSEPRSPASRGSAPFQAGGSRRCRMVSQEAVCEDEVEGEWRRALGKAISLPRQGPKPRDREPEGAARKGGSREWRRQGIRRHSQATHSPSRGLSEDGENTTEDLVDPGKPIQLEARLSRRRSKILQSSRLLYQVYNCAALDRELQTQIPDIPAPAHRPRSPEPTQGSAREIPRGRSLVRQSLASPFTLWRDIPEVRDNSEFLSLSLEHQKLQEAKFELITSESSYLRSLDIVVDHFQLSEKLQRILSPQERQWLFSRLSEVREVSRSFLLDLEDEIEGDIMEFDVCGILLCHLPAFQRVYIPYITNQSYQEKTFKRLIRENGPFLEAVEELESDPICQRLTLKSFLILPFQRVTRLRLLVQNILKRSTPGSEEERRARGAFEGLGELMRVCNENVRRMRSTEDLIFLSSRIDFECKIFPLISQSRRLLKDGELQEVVQGQPQGLAKRKSHTRTTYLHLFNDCLLLSRRRENGRFCVFDHCHSRNILVEDARPTGLSVGQYAFRLRLTRNHLGQFREAFLGAQTLSEKLRWISCLNPIKQEIDLTQHYGSQQVQCLRPYRAVQYDELTLEKADVLLVLHKCSDGWAEGCRLSDLECGWFPTCHVEPINCDQTKKRNLQERIGVKRRLEEAART